jgi:hypothetical protein
MHAPEGKDRVVEFLVRIAISSVGLTLRLLAPIIRQHDQEMPDNMTDDTTTRDDQNGEGGGFGCWVISLITILVFFGLLTAFLVLAGG